MVRGLKYLGRLMCSKQCYFCIGLDSRIALGQRIHLSGFIFWFFIYIFFLWLVLIVGVVEVLICVPGFRGSDYSYMKGFYFGCSLPVRPFLGYTPITLDTSSPTPGTPGSSKSRTHLGSERKMPKHSLCKTITRTMTWNLWSFVC